MKLEEKQTTSKRNKSVILSDNYTETVQHYKRIWVFQNLCGKYVSLFSKFIKWPRGHLVYVVLIKAKLKIILLL